MSEEDKQNDPIMQWVTFRLGDEKYGINVMQVQEVLRITEIAPVPGALPYVLGIINLRGNVVTVIDTTVDVDLRMAMSLRTMSDLVTMRSGNLCLAKTSMHRRVIL